MLRRLLVAPPLQLQQTTTTTTTCLASPTRITVTTVSYAAPMTNTATTTNTYATTNARAHNTPAALTILLLLLLQLLLVRLLLLLSLGKSCFNVGYLFVGYAGVSPRSAILRARSCLLSGLVCILQATPLFSRCLLYFGPGLVCFSTGCSEVWFIPGQVWSTCVRPTPFFPRVFSTSGQASFTFRPGTRGQLYSRTGPVYFFLGHTGFFRACSTSGQVRFTFRP